MQFTTTHTRNPLAGWDIDVTVVAENKEKIAHVRIDVNDFTESDEDVSPTATKWHKVLTQQGQFPGENKVVVTATDESGQDSSDVEEWDGDTDM